MDKDVSQEVKEEATAASATIGDQPSKREEGEEKDKSPSEPSVEEEPKAAASGGDWWGGWMSSSVLESAVSSVASVTNSAVQVAKTKSSAVYGLVSKDLNEVSSQASNVVGTAASSVKKTLEELDDKTDEIADKAVETVKKSVSSFWRYASGYAQQMFTEEDLESEAMVVKDNQPVLMDRLQAQLYALASDPDTFTLDPDPEDQLDWKEWKCDLEKRQGEISDLMISNVKIRQHYTDLVPSTVSHNVFWTRYFYKVHLIEVQEAKRQALKKRAEQTRLDSDSGMNWDDVADFAGGAGPVIPDEVQDKLLSDYERELISQKLRKGEDLTKKRRGQQQQDVTLSDEMERLDLKAEKVQSNSSSRNSPGSSQEKESVTSDDWEKLSDGEKSPKKSSKEEEEWVKP